MHNIVAGNNVLLSLLLPQGMIVFERDFWGDIFPLTKKVSQKMQIRTSSLINASIFYLNDFFYPGKMTCVALMRCYCWYWQFFSVPYKWGGGHKGGQSFRVKLRGHDPFFQTNDIQGDVMQDTRWEMDHGNDKGSNFFDDRPTAGLKQTLVIKWN